MYLHLYFYIYNGGLITQSEFSGLDGIQTTEFWKKFSGRGFKSRSDHLLQLPRKIL